MYNKVKVANKNDNSSTNGNFEIDLYDNITKTIYLKSSEDNESFVLGICASYLILFSIAILSHFIYNWFALAIIILLLWGLYSIITVLFPTYTIKISSESSILIKYLFGIKIKRVETRTNKMFGKVILTCREYLGSSGNVNKFGLIISSKNKNIFDIILICNQSDRVKTKKARDLLAGIIKLPTSFKHLSATTKDYNIWPENNVEQLIIEKI